VTDSVAFRFARAKIVHDTPRPPANCVRARTHLRHARAIGAGWSVLIMLHPPVGNSAAMHVSWVL
jgi:hypothetical protein